MQGPAQAEAVAALEAQVSLLDDGQGTLPLDEAPDPVAPDDAMAAAAEQEPTAPAEGPASADPEPVPGTSADPSSPPPATEQP
jgi:hypothetical protein